MCNCREGIIEKYNDEGRKVSEEKTNLNVHNCDYIFERNALIDTAERLAIREVGYDKDGKLHSGFSRAFSRAMNELAKSSGLVS